VLLEPAIAMSGRPSPLKSPCVPMASRKFDGGDHGRAEGAVSFGRENLDRIIGGGDDIRGPGRQKVAREHLDRHGHRRVSGGMFEMSPAGSERKYGGRGSLRECDVHKAIPVIVPRYYSVGVGANQ